MNTKRLADLLGVHSDSVRRWTARYSALMSDGATPPTGVAREYSQHDAAIMLYVATQREAQTPLEDIHDRLLEMQRNRWEGLPQPPPEWFVPTSKIQTAIEVPPDADDEEIHTRFMVKRAAEFAQLEVLKNELTHTRHELQQAQEHANQLQAKLDMLEASERASQGEVTDLRLQLSEANGKVAALEARLSAYAITGGDQPVPVALIIVSALLAGAVLVALALVLARVLL